MTDQANRRDFLRAEVRFPAISRILTPEEVKGIEQGLVSPASLGIAQPGAIDELLEQIAPGSGEEPIYRCFQAINSKLDFVVNRLLYADKPDGDRLREVVEISGSGVKFISQDRIPPDSYLKMDVIIPASLQFTVSFVLQVIRVQENNPDDRGGGYVHAGTFAVIAETARESIIEAVFRTQRKAIRMERKNREEF